MKKESVEKFKKDFPLMFQHECYFDCGDGWFDILYIMCHTIQSHINFKECPQVEVVQIKEKFGTLRFYYVGGDKFCEGVVRMGESISACVCETCGNAGSLRNNGGWVKTLCDEHYKNGD